MIRISTLAAATAALTMAATPAAAAQLSLMSSTAMPMPADLPVNVQSGAPEDADGWRRGRRHRGGVNAGDVIAGVLVIGAIAAIAGSSNNRNRSRERYEERDNRNNNQRYNTRDYEQSSGIDRAVDMCVDQVERGDDRVAGVDNASRTNDGWRASGSLEQGSGWNCWIDNDGRIREVDLGSRFSQVDRSDSYQSASTGPQLRDDAYARARAATRDDGASYAASDYDTGRTAVDADLENGPVPAYPGGPLPGEEGYAEAMGG